jgi:hypothetical protein
LSIQYHTTAELEAAVQTVIDATTVTVVPTVVQTALDLKAPLAAPTFTGNITTAVTASKIVATNASSVLVAVSPASAITASTLAPASLVVAALTYPDSDIQAATNSTPFGFVTADEANTLVAIVKSLHSRVYDLEARLVTLGLLTAS